MEQIDVLVVGGGVSGLATAAALAQAGRSVCVVERHPRAGMETSTHNSGVIHAGIYYPPGSLKARLCVEGRDRLYRVLRRARDPARAVRQAHRRGRRRGSARAGEARRDAAGPTASTIWSWWTRRSCARASRTSARSRRWSSPSTGIVSPEGVVHALRRVCDEAGVAWLPSTTLRGGRLVSDHLEIETDRERIAATVVVNAAGLYADLVSAMLGGEAFTIYPARGEYAELVPHRRGLIRGLVYPVPHLPGHSLGVHLVPTVDGVVLVGPTIRYQSGRADYESDRLEVQDFVAATASMLPGITAADLTLGGSGIRAKLCPPDQAFADFMIRPDARVPNLVHVAGIDSPGLTSCLAVGRLAAQIAVERL